MLSKSRYTYGLQCHLRLWNRHHRPDAATPPSDSTQHIFDFGTRVGKLATQRWPGGLEIVDPHKDPDRAIAETAVALADLKVPAIYEASFRHEGVFVAVDVLARLPSGGWQLVEVKSTASVKKQHLADAAIQLWVLRGAGVDVRQAGVLTLSRDYVYPGGDYDLQQLFALHDLTDDLLDMQADIAPNVAALHAVIKHPEPPTIPIGLHCKKPYECPFLADCSQGVTFPQHPVTELPGIGSTSAEAWAEKGVIELSDIPVAWRLNERQRRALDCTLNDRIWLSPQLADALREPRFPIHHLDFETTMPGLPRWANTRPFDQLPTQFSDHIEQADGTVQHVEFIHSATTDPRRPLAERLLVALGGDDGSIAIYTSFEKTVIRGLAGACPDLADELLALLDRCWDLKKVIDRNIYHPAFRGSFSLKAVVPALLADRSYDELTIADGMTAMRVYEVAQETPAGPERDAMFQALLDYCRMDTLVMVELRRTLADLANPPAP